MGADEPEVAPFKGEDESPNDDTIGEVDDEGVFAKPVKGATAAAERAGLAFDNDPFLDLDNCSAGGVDKNVCVYCAG